MIQFENMLSKVEKHDHGPALAELYASLAAELLRIVHANVHAPHALVEEACQTAWAGLVAQRPQLEPGSELSWLAVTATREALGLRRHALRSLSLEQERVRDERLRELQPAPGPDQVVELHDRLAQVAELPPRQRQLVLLHGFGYRYAEIARATGQSERTVQRQLLRARRRLAG